MRKKYRSKGKQIKSKKYAHKLVKRLKGSRRVKAKLHKAIKKA